METLFIKKNELAAINELLDAVHQFVFPLELPDNLSQFNQLSLYAHRLPERLVRFLTDFKYNETNSGVCLISGYEIDQERIGKTPDTWNDEAAGIRTARESLFLLFCSALLGDAIGWSTQQNGKIVHDIVPSIGDEHKQVGSSSLTKLWWHTEEAFHPFRCDYLGLLCLRNNEQVATTYASINSLHLSEELKKTLFSNTYAIYPDTSHLSEENSTKAECQDVFEMAKRPVRSFILTGDFDDPYLCIDPVYMDEVRTETKEGAALKEVIDAIDNNLQRLTLSPGDMLFLDNYRVVHGRDAYNATYGGTGRWLKRVNVARDLRKSRALRSNNNSRIIRTSSNI